MANEALDKATSVPSGFSHLVTFITVCQNLSTRLLTLHIILQLRTVELISTYCFLLSISFKSQKFPILKLSRAYELIYANIYLIKAKVSSQTEADDHLSVQHKTAQKPSPHSPLPPYTKHK